MIGSNATEVGQGLAVDNAGDVYITGYFHGQLAFQRDDSRFTLPNAVGGSDTFVAKYNSQGQCQWASRLGGSGADQGVRVAVDAYGSLFVAGYFTDGVVVPGATQFNLQSAGGRDVFVARMRATSGSFVWAGHMGGSADDEPFGLAVDRAGNVYTTGEFKTTADFDPGTQCIQPSQRRRCRSVCFTAHLRPRHTHGNDQPGRRTIGSDEQWRDPLYRNIYRTSVRLYRQ